MKNVKRGRIKEYAEKYGCKYFEGQRPWKNVKVDVAMPCATQNELDESDAQALVANGTMCVAEGANMPSSPEAVAVFQNAKILYAPGKASNAGGNSDLFNQRKERGVELFISRLTFGLVLLCWVL